MTAIRIVITRAPMRPEIRAMAQTGKLLDFTEGASFVELAPAVLVGVSSGYTHIHIYIYIYD